MKRVILLRGTMGSGKTTLCGLLKVLIGGGEKDFSFASADDWMVDQDGNYQWDPNQLGRVHASCQSWCDQEMAAGVQCVVVANTFRCLWEMDAYIKLAELYGYELTVLRLEGPIRQNVHGVTGEKVQWVADHTENYYHVI